jgi:ribA/ribD-fused uncharacterized protein
MHSPRSVQQLIDWVNSGATPKYVFFWGHQPNPDGSLSKSCFSQWWPATFTVEGLEYPTAEHYMMAAKAQLFGDLESLEKILIASHPNQAKALGRGVRGFDPAIWEAKRFEIVVSANTAKFAQHPDLANFLIGTGEQVLVEASPVDGIWGIGLAANHQHVASPEHWPGLNLLGFALMEVREQLRTSWG